MKKRKCQFSDTNNSIKKFIIKHFIEKSIGATFSTEQQQQQQKGEQTHSVNANYYIVYCECHSHDAASGYTIHSNTPLIQMYRRD